MWNHGEMIETFFNEETNDSVAVEDEVGSLRALVSDHSEESDELRSLRENVDGIEVGWDLAGNCCCWLFTVSTIGWAKTESWRGTAVGFCHDGATRIVPDCCRAEKKVDDL